MGLPLTRMSPLPSLQNAVAVAAGVRRKQLAAGLSLLFCPCCHLCPSPALASSVCAVLVRGWVMCGRGACADSVRQRASACVEHAVLLSLPLRAVCRRILTSLLRARRARAAALPDEIPSTLPSSRVVPRCILLRCAFALRSPRCCPCRLLHRAPLSPSVLARPDQYWHSLCAKGPWFTESAPCCAWMRQSSDRADSLASFRRSGLSEQAFWWYLRGEF